MKSVSTHKSYFNILKFRTIRMDTPHDVPTHLLKNPEQYIILSGKMSIIGIPSIIGTTKKTHCFSRVVGY